MKRKRDFCDVKSIFADLKRRIDFDEVAEEEVVLPPEPDTSGVENPGAKIFYSPEEITSIGTFFGEAYDSNKKYFDQLFPVDTRMVEKEQSSEKVVVSESVALSASEPSTSQSDQAGGIPKLRLRRSRGSIEDICKVLTENVTKSVALSASEPSTSQSDQAGRIPKLRLRRSRGSIEDICKVLTENVTKSVALSASEPSTSQSSEKSCRLLEARRRQDASPTQDRVFKRVLPGSTRAEDWSLSVANANLYSGCVVTRGKVAKHGAVGSSDSSASGRTL